MQLCPQRQEEPQTLTTAVPEASLLAVEWVALVWLAGRKALFFEVGHRNPVSLKICPSDAACLPGLEALGPPHHGIAERCEHREANLLLLPLQFP